MCSWLTTVPHLAFTACAATLVRGAGPELVLGLGGRLVEMGSTAAAMLLVGMELGKTSVTDALYQVWAPLHAVSFHWSAEVIHTWGHPSWAQPFIPMPTSPQKLALLSPFFDDPYFAIAVLFGWTALWVAWSTWCMPQRDVTA